MSQEKLQVLFLSRYARLGASSRYRFFQYFPDLEREGISCSYSPLLDDRYLQNFYQKRPVRLSDLARALTRRLLCLTTVRRYDLLVVEKELLIYCPPLLERVLAALGVPYLVDYDDAIFHQYDQNPRRLVRALLGRKIATVMNSARVVTAGCQYLAEYARRAGARQVEVLPTVVDLDLYPVPASVERDTLVIGWIGSPSSAVALPGIAAALAEVCRFGQARVVLVGAGQTPLPGVPVESVGWSEETEVSEIARFDVGIMPLLDDAWARGKCGFKLIQYMACALPVVAANLGVNCEIVDQGENGFLAGGHEEWVAALKQLLADRELRVCMGKAGREKVEKFYCKQVTAPRLSSLIKSAAGAGK